MAARNYSSPKCLVRELVEISGSFAPNGSSAVDAASRQGLGFTVAWTSTGLFTITFTDKYSALVSANATLQLAAADDKFAQVGVVSLSAKTAQIRIMDASAAAVADVAAAAGNRVNFCFKFRNSAVAPVRGT